MSFYSPISFASLLGILIWPHSLLGANQPTKEFQKSNAEFRKEIATILPDGNFQVSWAQQGDDWIIRLKGKTETVGGKLVGDQFHPLEKDALRGAFKKSLPVKRLRSHPAQELTKNQKSFPDFQWENNRTVRVGTSEYNAPKGWSWAKETLMSPDEKWACAIRVNDVQLRRVNYVRSSPSDKTQPEPFTITYSKPGDKLRTALPVIFNKDTKLEIDTSLVPNPFSIGKFHWRKNNKLWFEYIERGFGCYRLLEFDPLSKTTRIIAEEKSDKFVHVYQKCGWWDIGNNQLLWRSEQDGWNHLYRVDIETGKRQQLTSGQWVVREINHIQDDQVYFQLSGYFPEQDPYYLHHARLNLSTEKMTTLTERNGTHEIFWSPDRKYCAAKHSRVDSPPVYELRLSSNGQLIQELWRYDGQKNLQQSPYLPERFATTDRDGKYSIHGVIWKPKDFDPNKSYPILEEIYAGPHGAFTPKSWKTWYGARHEAVAAGFLVVQIDSRGTNFRGREFQQYAYKNLRDSGFPDRIKWIKEAAKTRPWMDLSRVGIYGGSAGGQSALAALLWHGDFYKAAAADCGCHDNRMDKIWWNEQWLDWPVGEAYQQNSNTAHVDQLRGDLFLTVGEVDTNVDPSSTYQVVDALIKADKDFEYLMVPNGKHGVGEKPYLRRKRIEFFKRKLLTR